MKSPVLPAQYLPRTSLLFVRTSPYFQSFPVIRQNSRHPHNPNNRLLFVYIQRDVYLSISYPEDSHCFHTHHNSKYISWLPLSFHVQFLQQFLHTLFWSFPQSVCWLLFQLLQSLRSFSLVFVRRSPTYHNLQ